MINHGHSSTRKTDSAVIGLLPILLFFPLGEAQSHLPLQQNTTAQQNSHATICTPKQQSTRQTAATITVSWDSWRHLGKLAIIVYCVAMDMPAGTKKIVVTKVFWVKTAVLLYQTPRENNQLSSRKIQSRLRICS